MSAPGLQKAQLQQKPKVMPSARIAVVIPAFKVKAHILDVLKSIGSEVHLIYVVDDACPERSGVWVKEHCLDPRLTVIEHPANLGVGGATLTGYRSAIANGADIIVKIDGDGQTDPRLLMSFVQPILSGDADYTKGNRFFDPEDVRTMPFKRLLGNAALSFITKMSSGYWDIFDPTNGYTAIHADMLRSMPLQKISRRYFFETDMLFRLNILRAVVQDVPMESVYGTEISNMRIRRLVGEFLIGHLRNTAKRVLYNYYLRGMSVASLELPLGILSLSFGIAFGLYAWNVSLSAEEPATAGTVMLAALPVILGVQLILAFISYDVSSVPRIPRHRRSGVRFQ